MAKLIIGLDTDDAKIIKRIEEEFANNDIVCIPSNTKLTALDENGVWRTI